MPILRAVVFDLDDTLYPEREYVKSGLKAVAAWVEKCLGIPQDLALQAFLRLFAKGKRGNIFDIWLSDQGITPELWVPQMVEVYRNHRPHIIPYKDVLALLPQLRQVYRLGVVTDGHAYVQRKKLEALKLVSYFDAIVFSDDLGKEAWKPSIIPFESILKRLRTKGHESVYVADNPLKDFVGARAVGMWTVRVRRPEGLYSQLEPPSLEYAPHWEISTFDELTKVLAQIEGNLLNWHNGVDSHD